MITKVAPTPQDQGGFRSPWDPEQRRQSLILTGRAVKMLRPTKNRRFGIFQARLTTDAVFGSETAGSGLENKNILKLDEKMD